MHAEMYAYMSVHVYIYVTGRVLTSKPQAPLISALSVNFMVLVPSEDKRETTSRLTWTLVFHRGGCRDSDLLVLNQQS